MIAASRSKVGGKNTPGNENDSNIRTAVNVSKISLPQLQAYQGPVHNGCSLGLHFSNAYAERQ